MLNKWCPKSKEIEVIKSYLENGNYLNPICSFEDSTYDNFKSH